MIFEPYFTTGKQGRGTGLGLATVKANIDEMGGFIDVFSDYGLGATFRVFLPLVDSGYNTDVSQQPYVPSIPKRHDLKGKVLLVVDDELNVLKTIVRLIEFAGGRCYSAQSVAEAQQVFKRHFDDIDIVLVDLIMPDGGAEVLLPLLVSIAPKLRAIVCSGVSDPGGATNDFTAIKATLRKPINLAQLSSAILQATEADSSMHKI